MKLSLKPHHLKRYKDIAMLFLKYGNSDLAKEFEHADAGDEKKPEPAKPGQPAPFFTKKRNVIRYSSGGGTLIRHYGFIEHFALALIKSALMDGSHRSPIKSLGG